MGGIVSRNNINRFVQTSKTGYKVPEFLLNKYDNIPHSQEFLKKYSTNQDEIPLWWMRDIELPLTKKETRHAKKQTLVRQRALQQQQNRLELANYQYKKLLQKQEEQFAKRCSELEKQVALKQEELDMLERHNKLEYENKLLELELELQQINKEKLYYQRERQRLTSLEEKQKEFQQTKIEWNKELEERQARLAQEFEEKQEIKKEVQEEYEQKGLTLDNGDQPTKEDDKKTSVEKDRYFEKFDTENIVEVKSITLKNKQSGFNELYNLSFNVKKSAITVIYSQSQRALQSLERALTRSLPEYMSLKGQVRFEGGDIGVVLRREFREASHKQIISLTRVEDNLSGVSKKTSKLLKEYNIDRTIMDRAFQLLGLDTKIIKQPLSKIEVEKKHKLALAVVLATNAKLKILSQPLEGVEKGKLDAFIGLLHQNRDSARLVLTNDKTLAAKIDDCSLYTI